MHDCQIMHFREIEICFKPYSGHRSAPQDEKSEAVERTKLLHR